MRKTGDGIYTDAQWLWLYDRHCEGYSIAELCRVFACHRETVRYHWKRLGLVFGRNKRPTLNRKEFDALGRRKDG